MTPPPDGTNPATYSYFANSALVDHIVFAHSGAAVMTNQNTYGVNQIASRGVPGYADVMGLGLATNTVKVNGTNAYQKWEYFREQMGTNNSSAAQWMGVNVTAPGQTTVSGNVFVAKNPETFGYDADGNMTNDGRWIYTWDAENQLVNMTSLSNGPGGSLLKLDFVYDFAGRRIQKLVSTNSIVEKGSTHSLVRFPRIPLRRD